MVASPEQSLWQPATPNILAAACVVLLHQWAPLCTERQVPRAPAAHLTATMCLATASGPRRSVSHARTVRAFSIVSAVVNVLLCSGEVEQQHQVSAASHCGEQLAASG